MARVEMLLGMMAEMMIFMLDWQYFLKLEKFVIFCCWLEDWELGFLEKLH